jgi:adenylate kinase family enzyme
MRILLTGFSGSGKSTLGKGLAAKLAVKFLSFGDEIRRLEAGDGSYLSQRIQQQIVSSTERKLSTDVVLDVVSQLVPHPHSCDWVLDGFPRKEEHLVSPAFLAADAIVFFWNEKAIAVRRTQERGRSDDGAKEFERRWRQDVSRFPVLLERIRLAGTTVIEVSGIDSVEVNLEYILKHLGKGEK